jgi:hypothetical protein
MADLERKRSDFAYPLQKTYRAKQRRTPCWLLEFTRERFFAF